MRFARVMLVLLFTTGAACSRGVITGDDLPTAPTQRATRLTITPVGGGSILSGETAPVATSGRPAANRVSIGAFAEFNIGQGQYVEAAWASSDDSVIAVVDNMLVARSPGTATLTATFEGLSDSEDFVVDGGFIGRWSGAYVVERCSGSSGSMQDVLCRPPDASGRAGTAPVGATLPFALEIAQVSGDDISGVVSFGSLTGVLTGKDRRGGYFYLTGQLAGAGTTINIVDWNMRAARDVMDGVVAYQVRIDGLPGIGTVGGRLTNMTRQ